MPDIYAHITDVDPSIQTRLVDVLEMRAGDPRQRSMWDAYLSEIPFPPGAYVLEIGCGTGAVSRILAEQPGVDRVLGVDPSSVFIATARALSAAIPHLTFEESDGRSLPLEDNVFDVVVVHQTLSHVPEPERLLAEGYRVLRPGGYLALFDGDYSTATVATGAFDPLEACVDAFRASYVHDAWVVRRLPQLVLASGFEAVSLHSHGYVESPEGAYMLTWVDRGAETLVQAGHISTDSAEALKSEARRRSTTGAWFGHIAFASILARKPL